MPHTVTDAHRPLVVLGDLRSDLTERLLADSWPNLSWHGFPTAREALRTTLGQPLCLWFVPAALPDMTGLHFIELLGELRPADRFVLIARQYDESDDRRASCLTRTTYSVWPMAPPLFQEVMDTFLTAAPPNPEC